MTNQFPYRITRLLVCVAFPVLVGVPLVAQDVAPRLSLTPIYDAPRSHAPIQLNAKLAWGSPKLLEGRLQLDFYASERKVHSWISRDLALSAGEITLPVMIPSVILPKERDQLNVEATFIGPNSTSKYDELFNLPCWADWKRVFVIGIVHPDSQLLTTAGFTTSSVERLAWLAPFQLDGTIPHRELSLQLASRVTTVDPTRFPVLPLELLAFDLVVVTSEGLEKLNEGQLAALAAWTEAGGAVCVAGERARSKVRQDFLKRILAASPEAPQITFGADEKTRPLLSGNPAWLIASPGVGRSLVTFRPVKVETPQWRDAVLSLWRLRHDQVQAVRSSGRWKFELPDNLVDDFLNPVRLVSPESSESGPSPSWWQLRALLMPQRVEGVPFHKVALLLGLCLMAIGPGDYFLLTWLRRRRWTWWLFPSIAIGFSMFTVRLAQSQMGAADHETSITFVDLTQDGRVARETRFELLFAASEKQYREDLQQTQAAALEERQEIVVDQHGLPLPQSIPRGVVNPDPATIVGRAPVSYVRIRQLRQWRPELARYTSIGPGASVSVPDVDWTKLTAEMLSNPSQRERLLRQVQTALPNAQLILLHGDESLTVQGGTGGEIVHTSVSSPAEENPSAGNGGWPISRVVEPNPVDFPVRAKAAADLAANVSIRGRKGLFRIVSQIAPNAAGNLEDLGLLDRTDPDQWLLLILTEDENGNRVVYRRLLRTDANSAVSSG